MDAFLNAAAILIVSVMVILMCFGCHYAIKVWGYDIFFEDAVRQTITDMVRSGALN